MQHPTTQYVTNMCQLWSELTLTNMTRTNNAVKALINCQQQLFSLPLDTAATVEYAIDYCQRSILFCDTLRKRGNQYLQYLADDSPPVLIFKYKVLLDARTFPQPVNYALVEIEPVPGVPIDQNKRPYVIVDPRAGHGAGIGGFKDDSQVGVLLRAGHPVYFVIFFAKPEPSQTLRDVALAEEQFLHTVAARHPNSPKLCLIGNCQGGWAVMALAAARPDIAGVLMINGAPLSYWAGENGKTPMRYLGGIVGGSWLAQFAGDLGHGYFDGANLVMNFEKLNPANTYWKKYYHLFSHIDTEEEYFLKFERWWGSFILMNTQEMRGIVDNLFIGNKLAHGEIPLDQHNNIDLRKIRSPIIIFCSEGDHITPPQQALNWICDIYKDAMEIKLAGQVIVYLVHETIGHLGIFVSTRVATKELPQLVNLHEYIEHLPPGLYEMVVEDNPAATNATEQHHVILKERSLDHIRSKNPKVDEDENLFKLVGAVSNFNVMAYDLFGSTLVRNLTSEFSADLLRQLHPLRMQRYRFSDLNPSLALLPTMADWVQQNRQTLSPNNPYLALQETYSTLMETLLDGHRMYRDAKAELMFYATYGALNISLPADLPFRQNLTAVNTEQDPQMTQTVLDNLAEGGVAAAIIRILLLFVKAQGFARGNRILPSIQKLRENKIFAAFDTQEFHKLVLSQSLIVDHDAELAIASLPDLVKNQKDRRLTLVTITDMHAFNAVNNEAIQQLLMQINQLLTKRSNKKLA
ncbi:DUF3141 domain-containing protein [soil metagenome]